MSRGHSEYDSEALPALGGGLSAEPEGLCSCLHRQSQHAPGRSGALGHGGCLATVIAEDAAAAPLPAQRRFCPCQRFTWVGWVEEPA